MIYWKGVEFMNLSRNDSRMLAMTVLYQIDLFKRKKIDIDVEEVIKNNLEDLEYDLDFSRSLINGVINQNDELEVVANSYLNNWTINKETKSNNLFATTSFDFSIKELFDNQSVKEFSMLKANI